MAREKLHDEAVSPFVFIIIRGILKSSIWDRKKHSNCYI